MWKNFAYAYCYVKNRENIQIAEKGNYRPAVRICTCVGFTTWLVDIKDTAFWGSILLQRGEVFLFLLLNSGAQKMKMFIVPFFYSTEYPYLPTHA